MKVEVQRLAHARDLPLPAYATAGAAGLDLVAAIDSDVVLPPGRHQAVPTGIALALPVGAEGQVRPRSGLALRHGLTVLNSPGTIDCDYRGELGIVLINHGSVAVQIAPLDRIAQLVIAPVAVAQFDVALSLSDTGRAGGGYGSTGV